MRDFQKIENGGTNSLMMKLCRHKHDPSYFSQFFFLQVLLEGFADTNRLYKSGCEHLPGLGIGLGLGFIRQQLLQNCLKLFGIYAALV